MTSEGEGALWHLRRPRPPITISREQPLVVDDVSAAFLAEAVLEPVYGGSFLVAAISPDDAEESFALFEEAAALHEAGRLRDAGWHVAVWRRVQ